MIGIKSKPSANSESTNSESNQPFHHLVSFCLIIPLLSFTLSCTRGAHEIQVSLHDGSTIKMAPADTFRMNLGTEPPSLDWQISTDTVSSTVTDNLMEGLVQFDLKDKELALIPALASQWTPSDSSRKWTFQLRQDVKWSDGQTFTAQHVEDAWKRLLTKETASEYAYFLFGIKNARAFNEGKAPWTDVGVKVTGPHELVVDLEKPMGYFPQLLTHHSTFPARVDVIQKHGVRWTDPQNIVTLGPFTLKSWQHDKMIVMERFDNYYGDKPAFKYIAGYMIQEQATAINLFESNKLDAVEKLPSVELRKLKDRKEHRQTSTLSLYYYGINTTKKPMDNPDVRKAIAMSIDRKELVQMLSGGQIPMTSWVPKGMFGYEPDRGLPFNPEKARELLKKAGYSDLSKFPKLEIKFNTNEDHMRVGENVQAQLKRNLGINVELKNEEWKVYLNTLKTDPPHLYRFGWAADYPDPDTFFTVLASYSENNRTRWKNAKYDELIEKGGGSTNKEERRKLYEQAQKILVEEEVPVIPFYVSMNHLLVSPRVENYPLNVMNKNVFKGIRLK